METNSDFNDNIKKPQGFIYSGWGHVLLFLGGISIFIGFCIAVSRLFL